MKSSQKKTRLLTYRRNSRFLDPQQVEDAIREIANLANKNLTSIALIGGVAMEFYGSDRMTTNVDFVAEDYLPLGPSLKKKKDLSFGGISATTKHGHPVDIIVREDEYRDLYLAALDNAVDENLPARIVKPEYLAALKMAAGRDKDEIDLKTLIRLDVLDVSATRKIIQMFLGKYAAREFDSICEEVAWLKTRE